jgi:hypothetical protein
MNPGKADHLVIFHGGSFTHTVCGVCVCVCVCVCAMLRIELPASRMLDKYSAELYSQPQTNI